MKQLKNKIKHQTEEAVQNVTDRKRTEEALAEVQNRYRELFDNISIGLCLTTPGPKGAFVDMNPAMVKMFEADSSEQLMSLHPSEIYLDHNQRRLIGDAIVAKGFAKEEVWFKTLKGRPIWCRITATKQTDSKSQVYFSNTIEDFTERKRAEQSLRLKNLVFDASISANSIANLDGVITEVNDTFLRIWGYPGKDEVVGKPLLHFINDPNEAGAIVTALNGTGQWEGEYTAKKKDGSTFIAYGMATTVKDENGKVIGYQSAVMDITERKRVEEELKISQERMLFATEGAKLGIWNWNIITGELIWSDKCKELFGIPLDETMSYQRFSDALLPDDRERTDKAVKDALDNHTDYDIEYRSLWPDGSIHWLTAKGRGFYDAAGKALRLEGVVLDITERKRVEEALREAKDSLERRVAERTAQLESINKDLIKEIDKRKQIEDRLQKDEERYKSLITATSNIVWTTDAHGEVADDLSDFRAFTGQSYEQIKGWGWLNAIHPDDQKKTSEAWFKAVGTHSIYEIEYRMKRHDGQYRWFLVRGVPVLEKGNTIREWVGTLVDITERKQLEENLHKQREEQQTILDSIQAWVFYKDKENRFIRVNKVFCDVMGMSKEQLEGKSCFDLYPREQANAFWIDDKMVMDSGQPKMNIIESMDSPQGRRWVQTDKIPYRDKSGNVIGIIGFTLDITERKLAENELAKHRDHLEELVNERTQELSTAVENLARSNKELEQFAYVASHDLQEPLRMVSSYTQLLALRYKDKLDPKANSFINFAVDGANRMQRLIQDLLSYSRVTTRGKPLTSVDAHTALGEAILNLQTAIKESGAMVTNDDLPTINVDYTQLVQLFQNLIGNAIKFHGATPPRIHISAIKKGNEWVFSIKDNGIGIEPQYFQKIFVVFQRLHAGDKYPGTGIGLAICARIVLRHGGRIWVESEAGKGSTFFFTLPAGKNEDSPQRHKEHKE